MLIEEQIIEIKHRNNTYKFVEQQVNGILRKVNLFYENKNLVLKIFGLEHGKYAEHSPAHLHLVYKNYNLRINLEKLGFLCLEDKVQKNWHCTEAERKQIERLKKEKIYPILMSYLSERHKVLYENFKKVNNDED